tara:strand:+ start:8509 stop:8661 length:153 start_codon:yes stop_codon:yes gene_type:complete
MFRLRGRTARVAVSVKDKQQIQEPAAAVWLPEMGWPILDELVNFGEYSVA